MITAAELIILVFHICEYLIKVSGMNGMFIKLNLCRMRIVLRINYKDVISMLKHDIAFHCRKEVVISVVQLPLYLRCYRR